MANSFADEMAQIFQRQYDGSNGAPDFSASSQGQAGGFPSVNLDMPKVLSGTAGAQIGSPIPQVNASPIPAPSNTPTIPTPSRTPISDAAQQIQANFPNLPSGVAQVAGVGGALAKGVWNALTGAWQPTTGNEVGAAKIGDVWRSLPSVGVGEIGAEALGAHDALQTPLRDVPVLGTAVRAGEALGGALNQGSQIIGEPLATTAALAREATPKPLRDLIRSTPVQTASPLAGLVSGLWGKDNPQIFQAAGTTSQEAETLTRGFLTGQNTPDQNRRFEEIVNRATPSEAEANPIPHTILTGALDPLTYADAGALLPKIGEIQQLRRVWAAAGDVTKAGETLGEASPLEHLIAQALQPKSIGATELLSKDALGITKPADQSAWKRIFRPFGDTPTSGIIKNIERARDNLIPFLADGGTAYETKVKFIQNIVDASAQGKRTPELMKFMGENGIKNAEDLHRAIQALAGYNPTKVTAELTRAREVIASLEQTTQTTRGAVFNPDVADFLKGQGENLGGAYRNIFDTAIQGWKDGKLDIQELKRGVESIAGVKLADDATMHMAGELTKYAGVKPPRFIQQLFDTMKAYEGMLYIGTNPASMVNNVVGDVARLVSHGVNPATAAQEFADLSRRVGYRPPENIGAMVRGAINPKNVEQAGAYGANLPKWIRDVPGLKQMSEAFDQSQVWGRQAAWATGFERFLNHNFAVPELPDLLKAHLGEEMGRVMQQLKGARNTKEAEDILLRNAPTWERYSQEIAINLTRDMTELAGKDFTVTPEMLADAFPEATRQQFRKTLQGAWDAVQRGEDAPTAFRRVRAQVYGQDLAKDTFSDLFPQAAKKPTAPDLPLTEPIRKAQPQYRQAPTPRDIPPAPSKPSWAYNDIAKHGVPDFNLRGEVVSATPYEDFTDTATQAERAASQGKVRSTILEVRTPNGKTETVIAREGIDSSIVGQRVEIGAKQDIGQRLYATDIKPSDLPPEAPAAPAPIEPPPTPPTGGMPTGTRISPEDFARQENSLLAPSAYDPNSVRDFARTLSQENTVPNELRYGLNAVDQATWDAMDKGARQTLLERTLAQQKNAGQFGLSDVYQARGDVPTAMPDVSNAPPVTEPVHVSDKMDVFRAAMEKGIGTATPEGRTVNQHLLNALNKHKGADAARFTVENIGQRADEAIGILKDYTPEEKQSAQSASQTVALWDKSFSQDTLKQNPVHDAIQKWVFAQKPKQFLIKAISEHPAEAQKIERVSQELARSQFGEHVGLFSPDQSGKFRALRGIRQSDTLELRPFDSFTSDNMVAQDFADYFYAEIKLPVDNIFTWHGAHPAWTQNDYYNSTKEFVTNAKDTQGAEFVNLYKKDGTLASPEELARFRKDNPQLNYLQSSQTQAAKPGEAPLSAMEQNQAARRSALEDATKIPVHNLPDQLGQNVKDAAGELKFQLGQGEAGKRLSYYNQEQGGRTFMAEGSSNAPFYKELFAKYKTGKPAVESALNKIIKDNGVDKGTNVERLKEFILQQLADGLETSAGKMPPDWEARLMLDYPQDKIDEAWKVWDDANKAGQSPEVGTQAAAQFGENVTPPTTTQGQMFTAGQDAPLFSGTPQTSKESAFLPQEVGQQGKMFSTAPEFKGAKQGDTLAVRQARTEAKRIQQTIDEWTAQLDKEPTNRNLQDAIEQKRVQLADAQKRGLIGNASETNLRAPDPYAQHGAPLERMRAIVNDARASNGGAAIDPVINKAWHDAMAQQVLDTIEQAFTAEALKGAKVIPPDVLNAARGYLKQQFSPALREAMQGANAAARQFQEATVLNYDHRWNIDSGMATTAPFSYWWLHTLGNYTKDFIDHPAMLAFLLHLRQNFDTQAKDMPARFQHRVKLPFPLASRMGLGDSVWIDPLRTIMPFADVFQLNNLERATYQGAGQAQPNQQAMSFLQSGKATHPDEADAQAEYDVMMAAMNGGTVDAKTMQLALRAIGGTKGSLLQDAVAIAQTHLDAHTKALSQPNTMYDPYPNHPEKNQAAVDGFKQVISTLQKPQTTDPADNPPDMGSAFNDLFGIHTPYKLAYQLLTNNQTELQNTLASIPAVRLLRGATSPFVAGGVTLGLNGKYDQAYYERALKELTAEGKITPEQAKVALLQQKGETWDMAKSRAGLENYGIRELTGLMGARGYAMTPGEQKLMDSQKQRDQMEQDAVRQLGGNPNMTPTQQYQFLTDKGFYKSDQWRQFQTANPELETTSFINKGYGQPADKQQEARYRDYLANGIWEKLNGASELQGKLWKAQLGDTFYNLFYKKDTRNVDAIPTSALLGWSNALATGAPNQVAGMAPVTPDPFKVTFPTDAQNKAYQTFYDDVQKSIGWDTIHALENQYFATTDKTARAAMLKANPQLKVFWDTQSKFYTDNPDLLKALEQAGAKAIPASGNAAPTQGSVLSQAVTAAGLNWDSINAQKGTYDALPKGTGARSNYLKAHPDYLRYIQLVSAIYGNTTSQASYTPNQPRITFAPYTPRPRYNKPPHKYSGGGTPRIYMNFKSIGGQGKQSYQRPPYNYSRRIVP